MTNLQENRIIRVNCSSAKNKAHDYLQSVSERFQTNECQNFLRFNFMSKQAHALQKASINERKTHQCWSWHTSKALSTISTERGSGFTTWCGSFSPLSNMLIVSLGIFFKYLSWDARIIVATPCKKIWQLTGWRCPNDPWETPQPRQHETRLVRWPDLDWDIQL